MKKTILISGLLGLLTTGCAMQPSVDDLEPMHAATEVMVDPGLASGLEEQPPEASPEGDGDLWERIRAGFALDLDQDNARIAAQRNG